MRKKFNTFKTGVLVLFLSCFILACSNTYQKQDIAQIQKKETTIKPQPIIPVQKPYTAIDLNGKEEGFGWNDTKWNKKNWPLGSHIKGANTQFAVYSKNATKILLEIYTSTDNTPAWGEDAAHSYWMEKGSDNIWRAQIAGIGNGTYYGFRCWGENWLYKKEWKRGNSKAGFICDVDSKGNRFNPNKVLFDPRAKEISHDKSNPEVLAIENNTVEMYATGSNLYKNIEKRFFDTGKWAPKAIVINDTTSFGLKPAIPEEDAIIYEAHTRGLTQHTSSASLQSILQGIEGFENVNSIPDDKKGTYAGAALMASYLKSLGITTIELLPVHESDNDGNPSDKAGGNFWGYMTYGFFAPDRRYSSDKTAGGPTREFKEMVKAFHDEGMEVYLDVVYNHSGEGGTWGDDKKDTTEITFMRGFDNSEYYCLCGEQKDGYWQTSGCGNNLQCDNPMVRDFILDSLSYWIDSMGVDGFRFDLAPVLAREKSADSWNFNAQAQTISDIAQLGKEKNVEMIAEAWDCSGSFVGNFPSGWAEWNGRYRDSVRSFITNGNTSGKDGLYYADAFFGDYNNFNDQGGPQKTINFLCAHDGFTLADLVSYSGNGNAQNGTLSWPFGPSDGGNSDQNNPASTDKKWRRQAQRNFMLFQMFSRGIPMIVYGDELNRTQNGNNNPYNVDSVCTWNNYSMINTNEPQGIATGDGGNYHNNFGSYDNENNVNGNFIFFKTIANLRKNERALKAQNYDVPISYSKEDGSSGFSSSNDRCARIHIDGDRIDGGSDYLLFVNMYTEPVNFTPIKARKNKRWIRIVDTNSYYEKNYNIWNDEKTAQEINAQYEVNPWSIVVLKEVSKKSTLPIEGKVLAPQISVPEGDFWNEITIFSSTKTTGAEIRYTTDNASVTKNSPLFSKDGLLLKESKTLKLRAFKTGKTPSDTTSVRYRYRGESSTKSENKSGVMLQSFNWASASRNDPSTHGKWYNIIQSQSEAIKNTFEYVWFPQPAKSHTSSPEGYVPTELNDLNNAYGTKEDLIAAINAISPAKPIADIVINHRDGSNGSWGSYSNPSWDKDFFCIAKDDEGFSNASSEMNGSVNKGSKDSGEGYGASRDLDHSNKHVRDGIVSWMNSVLKRVGFVGWRYDYVKGFDGSYVKTYNEKTKASFSVGEYWPSNSCSDWASAIDSWLTKAEDSRAFDFILKRALNDAFGWISSSENHKDNWDLTQLNNEYSLMNKNPKKAITFIDNHDTGSTQKHWQLDPGDLAPAYAFLLTHPGYPCVAYQHYFIGDGEQYRGNDTVRNAISSDKTSFTFREHIEYLIQLRKNLAIEYDSPKEVLVATATNYVAKITGKKGEVIVKIGGDNWKPTKDGYKDNNPIYKGVNFAIWQKNKKGISPLKVSIHFKPDNWDGLSNFRLYSDATGNVSLGAKDSNGWYTHSYEVSALPKTVSFIIKFKQYSTEWEVYKKGATEASKENFISAQPVNGNVWVLGMDWFKDGPPKRAKAKEVTTGVNAP